MLQRLATVLWVLTALLSGCGSQSNDPVLQQYYDPGTAKIEFDNLPWYDFGDRTVSTESLRTIQIANTGKNTATQLHGSFYLSVHFSFRGGTFPGTGGTCGEVLESRATCNLVVAFAPQYPGTFEQPVNHPLFRRRQQPKGHGPLPARQGHLDTTVKAHREKTLRRENFSAEYSRK